MTHHLRHASQSVQRLALGTLGLCFPPLAVFLLSHAAF